MEQGISFHAAGLVGRDLLLHIGAVYFDPCLPTIPPYLGSHATVGSSSSRFILAFRPSLGSRTHSLFGPSTTGELGHHHCDLGGIECSGADGGGVLSTRVFCLNTGIAFADHGIATAWGNDGR